MKQFDVTTSGSNAIVRVTGEIDVANVNVLIDSLQVAQESDATTVVVDLTDLTFIDSSGISALSRLQKGLSAQSKVGVLVCPTENVEVSRVLNLMGMSAAMKIYESLEQVDQ